MYFNSLTEKHVTLIILKVLFAESPHLTNFLLSNEESILGVKILGRFFFFLDSRQFLDRMLRKG